MKVTIANSDGPKIVKWEDLDPFTVVQSISNTENILLKVDENTAVRMTPQVNGAIGTIQRPGPTSMWHICHSEIIVKPAVMTS